MCASDLLVCGRLKLTSIVVRRLLSRVAVSLMPSRPVCASAKVLLTRDWQNLNRDCKPTKAREAPRLISAVALKPYWAQSCGCRASSKVMCARLKLDRSNCKNCVANRAAKFVRFRTDLMRLVANAQRSKSNLKVSANATVALNSKNLRSKFGLRARSKHCGVTLKSSRNERLTRHCQSCQRAPTRWRDNENLSANCG